MESELKELLIEAEKLKADYKNLEPFRRELVFRRINQLYPAIFEEKTNQKLRKQMLETDFTKLESREVDD